MKNLVLGRYSAYDSFVHKLDPRNKIMCLVVLMVAVFFEYQDYSLTFIMGGILFFFIVILMIVSHISFVSLLKSLVSLWFLILVLFIINVLVPVKNAESLGVAFYIGNFPIYLLSIFQSLKIVIRLILMLSLTLVLSATTSPLDMTFAFEWFMNPLKVIHFPAHEIAMTLSIALRFIPTLLNETERIMKAQSSRGVDFKHGKLSSRFKAIVALIVPLFISAFQRSEELADAMEARGYDPKAKRTRYHTFHWSADDTYSLLFCNILLGGVIYVSVAKLTLDTPLVLPWILISISLLITVLLLTGIITTNRKGREISK